jgi:Protein of unknown function (DUF3987)
MELETLKPLRYIDSSAVAENLQPQDDRRPQDGAKFDLRVHADKLAPVEGKRDRYYCPVCEGNNLTISPDSGAYQCWNGCDCAAIRNAIAPLPQPKSTRPQSDRTWVYTDSNGTPIIRTRRIDDGTGKRKIWQEYLIDGSWQAKSTPATKPARDAAKEAVMPYNYAAALEAIAKNQPVFWVEGESAVDGLERLGLTAITTIGGSGGYKNYGDYAGLLDGAELVLCPDCDRPGIKYAEVIAQDYPEAERLYAFPDSPTWDNLPQDKGSDVEDWIDSLRGEGLTTEQARDRILSAVEERRDRISVAEELDSTEIESLDSIVNSLISDGSTKPPQLFGSLLADPVGHLSKALGLPVEPFFVCLLPILASRLKAGTRLLIDPATDYYAPPIIWAGLVGDSGTLKTPILKALTGPLDDLQKEAFEEYQQQYAAYESDLQQWEATKKDLREAKPKPPALKDLYFSDFTIEAIADSIRYYSDEGYLVNIDELAAFFKSMDAYRNGKGSDRQRWLSAHSGSAIKVNRKSSEPIYLYRTSISLVGGIQPSVLEKQVLDDPTSEDGLWARFIWVRLPITTPPGISERPRFDLSQLLKGLYHSLNQVEAQTYRLSPAAITLWNQWNAEVGELIKQEPSGILRATYPKLKEAAARIALVAHITNTKLFTKPIEDTISGETLNSAIEFTRWLMGQTRMLYCEIGTSDNPKAARLIRFVNRFRGCGWVKTRTTTHWWAGNNKPTAKVARDFMAEVVALGYAISNNEPKDSPKFSILISSESGNSGNKTSEIETKQGLELLPLSGNRAVTDGNKIDLEVSGSGEPEPFVTAVTTVLPDSGNKLKACSEKTLEPLVTTVTAFPESENSDNDDIEWGASA